jgi:signal transduction histidine kinase
VAPVVVGVVGISAAVVVCLSLSTPMSDDLVRLLATTLGAAAVPGLAGALLLWTLRNRTIQTQAVAVALVAVLGIAAGVLVASSSMFLSTHDLHVLVVVLIAASTVGVLAALVLGGRVGRATQHLTEFTRRIGVGEPGSQLRGTAPQEFSRLADELLIMQERMSRAEKSRRELVAWVSHDLRTPLAGIRALVEALEDGVVEDPDTVARYLGTLRDQSDRLAHLVDDLFELSRLHSGSLQPAFSAIALDDLVSDALAGVGPAAEAAGVTLRGSAGGPPRLVEVAPRELGRALQNLLDNAVRATPPGGTVTLEATQDPTGVTLSVCDTGAGLRPDDIERLFEPGFTGDPARSPRRGSAGGSGLGLAIARGFAELHGGRLTAAGTDHGARFELWVPNGVPAPVGTGDRTDPVVH